MSNLTRAPGTPQRQVAFTGVDETKSPTSYVFTSTANGIGSSPSSPPLIMSSSVTNSPATALRRKSNKRSTTIDRYFNPTEFYQIYHCYGRTGQPLKSSFHTPQPSPRVKRV